jgi:large subunit ribosomal protein L13
MRGLKQKSYVAKGKSIERNWFVVDVTDKTLGRMATRIATILMGKHKPTWTSFLDTGDYVVIVNADKIKVTGKKREQRTYQRYSGYPGGLKEFSFENWFSRQPAELVRHAVKDMIRNTKLGRQQRKKLFVYAGPDHPHQAQCPKKLEIA